MDRLTAEAVRQAVEARLHLVPRFRQMLYVPRPGLGGPLWADAAAFDVADHVRLAVVPAPGDEAALLRVAEQLRHRRLSRPDAVPVPDLDRTAFWSADLRVQ